MIDFGKLNSKIAPEYMKYFFYIFLAVNGKTNFSYYHRIFPVCVSVSVIFFRFSYSTTLFVGYVLFVCWLCFM